MFSLQLVNIRVIIDHIFTRILPKLPVASITKEVNPRLAKRPLKTNGRLANRGLTSLVKEATGDWFWLNFGLSWNDHWVIAHTWSFEVKQVLISQ